jgi:hypothetical protein
VLAAGGRIFLLPAGALVPLGAPRGAGRWCGATREVVSWGRGGRGREVPGWARGHRATTRARGARHVGFSPSLPAVDGRIARAQCLVIGRCDM